jgi:hypothetical protein
LSVLTPTRKAADRRHQLLAQGDGGLLADRHDHRQGHAALAGRAVGRADDVGHGLVEVGVGQDDPVVLGPAHGLHPLAVGAGPREHRLGDVGAADEADGLDGRMVEDGLDAVLVAVHDVEDPGGRPASIISSARRTGTDGSRSEGLRMKALPLAMAGPIIHIGIMAGKLNGVIPATTPRAGASNRRRSRARALSVFALQQVRDPAGELDHLQAAHDVALGVGDDLAVLGRQQVGQLIHVGVEQAHELEHHPRPALGIGRGPGRLGGGGVGDGGVQLALGEASATRACTWPVLGSKTSPKRPDVPSTARPPTKWGMLRMTRSFFYSRSRIRPCGRSSRGPGRCGRSTCGADRP